MSLQNGQVATAQCFANPRNCYFIPSSPRNIGVVTLNGTSAVNINTPASIANQSRVFLQPQSAIVGVAQILSIANNQIQINSTNAGDTAVQVAWLCVNPNA